MQSYFQNNQPAGIPNPGGDFNSQPSWMPTFNAYGSSYGGTTNPYQVPSQQTSGFGFQGGVGNNTTYYQDIHGGQTIAPQYPGLSGNFVNWLEGQMGQGVNPFNLSTPLPTGGSTQPGQLTAGMNPMLSSLMAALSGGSTSGTSGIGTLQGLAAGTGPGEGALNFLAGGMQGSTLANIANNGISALPEWQSMIGAQQQNIQQNQANLQEQFAGMGDLAGSPFGTAMSNYSQQTTKDQNSLLGQLQQQNILQGQIPAAEQIAQLQSGAGQALGGLASGAATTLSGMDSGMSQYLQGLNQQAITNQYGEFNRTSPQNNPLIQDMLSMSQVYPPTIQTGVGGGGVGGLLSGMGSMIGGGAQMWNSAGNAGMCYLTSACVHARGLPDDCEELETLRWFRENVIEELPKGKEVIAEYRELAPRIVKAINALGDGAKRVWDKVYRELIQDAVYMIQHDQNDAALKLYHNYTQKLRMEYL